MKKTLITAAAIAAINWSNPGMDTEGALLLLGDTPEPIWHEEVSDDFKMRCAAQGKDWREVIQRIERIEKP